MTSSISQLTQLKKQTHYVNACISSRFWAGWEGEWVVRLRFRCARRADASLSVSGKCDSKRTTNAHTLRCNERAYTRTHIRMYIYLCICPLCVYTNLHTSCLMHTHRSVCIYICMCVFRAQCRERTTPSRRRPATTEAHGFGRSGAAAA